MDNYLYITIAILIAFSAILYVLYQTTSEKLKVSKQKNDEYEYDLVQMEEENSSLREELKIIAENRRNADEKVNELHTGDSVSNAINGLCKH